MGIDEYQEFAGESVGESDANGPKVETDSTYLSPVNIPEEGLTHERFPYPRFNRIIYDRDVAINHLIRNGGSVLMGTDREDAARLNLYTDDNVFSPGTSPNNRISAGSSTTQYCCVYPTKISGVRKLLAVDLNSATAAITVIDVDTMAVDSVVDLSGGLGAGTWYTQAVVADETNAYLCFEKSTNEQYVQAFKMSDWSVVSGWPAAGTNYGTGSGTIFAVGLIHMTATHLCIAANNYDTGSGSANMLFSINKSTGAIADQGNGDSPATGTKEIYALSSDGQNVYFNDDNGRLCSADVTDLTTGCGGTGWPWSNAGMETGIGAIACGGGYIVAAGTGASVGTPYLNVATAAKAPIAELQIDNTEHINAVNAVAFDGKNFWGRGKSTLGNLIYKFNVFGTYPGASSETNYSWGSEHFAQAFAYHHGLSAPSTNLSTNLISDGRDLWFGGVGDDNGYEINPYIFRLPMTRYR